MAPVLAMLLQLVICGLVSPSLQLCAAPQLETMGDEFGGSKRL